MLKILILQVIFLVQSEGAGDAILTFLGGFHPQTQSLWLTDIAHHHLAIAVVFIVAGHMYRTNFGIGHSMQEILMLILHQQEVLVLGIKDYLILLIIHYIFN